MSKKRSKTAKAKNTEQTGNTLLSRRKFVMIPIACAAIGTTAFGLNAIEMNKRELHDLTVIGNGTPTVVQIHDPKCPTCRRLKNIVSNAIGTDESVQYRLADVTSSAGKSLQEKYGVPHVTLLYFDAEGKHVHTTQGLQESQSIRNNVRNLFGSHS